MAEQVVHLVEGEVQVVGSSNGPRGSDRFNADLSLCWGGSTLRLSGDAATLVRMFEDCIDSLELIGDAYVESHGLDPEWKSHETT